MEQKLQTKRKNENGSKINKNPNIVSWKCNQKGHVQMNCPQNKEQESGMMASEKKASDNESKIYECHHPLCEKVFYDRKVDISKPFNDVAAKFIQKLAYLSIGIGIFSIWGTKLVNNLVIEGVKIPAIQYLRIDGADVWLFMGVILLVLARVFKKGIEIQNENDLTV